MALSPANSHGSGYPLGLTGATAATRYVGGTTTGAPASGTFAVGDFVVAEDGGIQICTVAGSPGTWTAVSGGGGSTDGWTADTDTWTYASATTFTVAGKDVTARFAKGTRLKLTQTTVKYFVVVGSSFSTDTTVTITGGTDYTFANAAVTANSYSYEASPQGYPTTFAFNAALTGVTGDTTTVWFSIIGNVCAIYGQFQGTSNATTKTATLPVAALSTGAAAWGSGRIKDNGTNATADGAATVNSGSATMTLYKDLLTTNAWTAGGAWYFLLLGSFVYRI